MQLKSTLVLKTGPVGIPLKVAISGLQAAENRASGRKLSKSRGSGAWSLCCPIWWLIEITDVQWIFCFSSKCLVCPKFERNGFSLPEMANRKCSCESSVVCCWEMQIPQVCLTFWWCGQILDPTHVVTRSWTLILVQNLNLKLYTCMKDVQIPCEPSLHLSAGCIILDFTENWLFYFLPSKTDSLSFDSQTREPAVCKIPHWVYWQRPPDEHQAGCLQFVTRALTALLE